MKRNFSKILTVILSVALLLSSVIFTFPVAAEQYTENASFMAGKYGIFLHYLSNKWDGTAEGFENAVNSFNAKEFARTVNETGASWVYLTLTQTDGIYCIPMDNISANSEIGLEGTQTDLVEKLYAALDKYGIKLMLYWIPGAPASNNAEVETMAANLGATERRNGNGDWILNDTTVTKMSAIMEEVSERYGDKISGWWIDGCYDAVNFTETYANMEANALRAGNPDAVVAFNNGTHASDCRFNCEDYTAGEICNAGTLDTDSIYDHSFTSQYSANGYQNHLFTFLGTNWGSPEVRYDTNQLVNHCLENVLSKNAALTFDVGISANGTISPNHVNQLVALDNALRQDVDLPLNFEDSFNPLKWIDLVKDGKDNFATDNIEFASGEEALNGEYSLKIAPPIGTVRTDVLLGNGKAMNAIKIVGNTDFSKTDFTNVTGIMLRLKMNSSKEHKFKINVMQDGVEKNTVLAGGAYLYDINGNAISTTVSAMSGITLPVNFNGFVFLPFETAKSEKVSTPGSYDNYQTYPESMVDFSQAYGIRVIFSESIDTETSMIIDDLQYYSGNTQAENCDFLRNLGYNSVLYKEQPSSYSFPMNFENYDAPLTSAKITYTRKINGSSVGWPTENGIVGLTTNANEVINGKVSYKINIPQRKLADDSATGTTYIFGNVVTNDIAVNGVEGLSSAAIKEAASNDYAYAKLRIKTPAGTSPYNIQLRIKQDGNSESFSLGRAPIGYNADGSRNISVIQADDSFSVPADFDGTVYIPIYSMRVMNKWTGAYTSSVYTAPELDEPFKLSLFLDGAVWENTTTYIDDIDFIVTGKNLPLSFEEFTDARFTKVNNVYIDPDGTNRDHPNDTTSVSYVLGSEALNGNASLKFTLREGNTRTDTDNITVAGKAEAKGIWMRIKVDEKNYASTDRILKVNAENSYYFKNFAILYDADGNRLRYNNSNYWGVNIPASFDGYVFMPFDGLNSRGAVDFTDDWRVNISFFDVHWNGATVTVDDISYFISSADWTDSNELNAMDADAWEAMRGAGYDNIYQHAQPDRYSIPLDFENGQLPFSSLTSTYTYVDVGGNKSWPAVNGNATLTKNALNGKVSNSVTVPSNSSYTVDNGYTFGNTVTNFAKFDGINSSATHIKMRIRIPAGEGTYATIFKCKQIASDSDSTFLIADYGYTKDGVYVDFANHWINNELPAGFDGTIYFSIGKAVVSDSTENSVGTQKVDFTQEFLMQLRFVGVKWEAKELLLDDIGTIITGDLNGDNILTSVDLAILQKKILNIGKSDVILSDLNGDGKIDLVDLVRLKKAIA